MSRLVHTIIPRKGQSEAVSGDITFYLASDKKVNSTSTLVNCSIAGLAMNSLSDTRPTTNATTPAAAKIRNDTETSLNP